MFSLDFFFEFWNNLDYYGVYEAIQPWLSKTEAEKRVESPGSSGSGVDWTAGHIEVGYALIHQSPQIQGQISETPCQTPAL